MDTLIRWSLRHRPMVLFLAVVLLAAGGYRFDNECDWPANCCDNM